MFGVGITGCLVTVYDDSSFLGSLSFSLRGVWQQRDCSARSGGHCNTKCEGRPTNCPTLLTHGDGDARSGEVVAEPGICSHLASDETLHGAPLLAVVLVRGRVPDCFFSRSVACVSIHGVGDQPFRDNTLRLGWEQPLPQ